MSSPVDRRGFSLLEVLLATSLVATAAFGLAQLFDMALRANLTARTRTLATALATQKMEQIRALPWGYDESSHGLEAGVGGMVSDSSTDLSVDPPTPGGSGLARSPPAALLSNSPPAVDFLDKDGRWVGTGSEPPTGTVYVRRWAIEPLPARPGTTLVIQVLVTTLDVEERRLRPGLSSARDVWLVSVKTRKAR